MHTAAAAGQRLFNPVLFIRRHDLIRTSTSREVSTPECADDMRMATTDSPPLAPAPAEFGQDSGSAEGRGGVNGAWVNAMQSQWRPSAPEAEPIAHVPADAPVALMEQGSHPCTATLATRSSAAGVQLK